MTVSISDNFGRLSIRLFSPLWLFKTSCICVSGYFDEFFPMGEREEVLDAIKEKNSRIKGVRKCMQAISLLKNK